MTGDALGPLGRRFLVAFALVALVAVALVAAAGLVGAERGLTSQSEQQREEVAARTAEALADAYRDAGGWPGADLSRAASIAEGAGANLFVLDQAGDVVTPQGQGAGPRHGGMPGMGMAAGRVTAPVTVDGAVVGEAVLAFGHAAQVEGRPVAWSWILGAAVGALLLSLVAAWFVSRQLTRPVSALTSAARSFAEGDRDAFVSVRGAGELGELADAFEDAVTAVRRAEGSRAQMAADVAHELRTPLAALQAGLEELRDGLAPADPETLARLHDQALRVGQVIGDLDTLFAAEVTTRAVRHEKVDLAEVARSEVAARAAQLRVADLRVETSLPGEGEPVWVRGDPGRLHQVVGNLLENCVRHCRAGDSVRVEVHPVESRPAQSRPADSRPVPHVSSGTAGRRGTAVRSARLVVADTGPGIAAADLEHVFDRFWRGAQEDGHPGSGLGLSVVRSLVEAHGGSVTAESDGRSGTTFTVGLPAWPEVSSS